MKKKITITIICAVLSCVCLIGTTFAWLVDKTDSVTNTFTVGNVDIELTESENLDLKMVPGNTITKDPKVTVLKNSEDCWVFVKIEESANFDTFMTYTMTTTGWTALPDVDGVYYREVAADDEDQPFDILDGNIVTVPNTVTKANMDTLYTSGAIDTNKLPTLTFTAYAVQQEGVDDAATAWTIANS
ncbi:MAG: hypothetical protein IJW53_03415 [Clostridia bacterium]|nr:hypothetical protein [Clostridia bacterium]